MTRHPPEDALPGLLDEDFRHPIWLQPDLPAETPKHIEALYWKLHLSMTPFDGRPYGERIVEYAKNVWMLCATESAHKDPYWLVGQVVRVREEAIRQAFGHQGPVIRRLCQEYIDTIVGAL